MMNELKESTFSLPEMGVTNRGRGKAIKKFVVLDQNWRYHYKLMVLAVEYRK